MTTILISDVVSELIQLELKNVVKRVVHDLGRKYEFDRKEAYEYLEGKYNVHIIPEEEEQIRVVPKKKSQRVIEEDQHPVMIKVKAMTQCKARTLYRGVYGQCKRCWNSQYTQLCKNHEWRESRHGRVDDGEHPEIEIRKIKSFI